MISTRLTENSPSFPFQSWDLAQGHLVCTEPKPFCRNTALVTPQAAGWVQTSYSVALFYLKEKGRKGTEKCFEVLHA